MKTVIQIKDSYWLKGIVASLLLNGFNFDFRNDEESYLIYVEKDIDDTNEYLNSNGISNSDYELSESWI